MTTAHPTDLQLDALREVANVGCGHAANALSRLVGGRKVHIDVPRVVVSDPATLSGQLGIPPEARVLVATLEMTGELSGHILIALPELDAHVLCAMLLGTPVAAELREPQRSALTEAANIIASATLSAIGNLTGFKLLPSVPALSECAGEAALDDAIEAVDEGAGVVVALEARFSAADVQPLEGRMFVVPAPQSLRRLLERLGV